MLFHALTGRVPFPGSGRQAKLVAHLTEAPPRATDLVPGLPRALDDVIARAMAKRPEDRFPTAGALAAAAREARSDVVLCHHPDDAAAARAVGDRLVPHGLEVREASAGDLADDLRSARACLVFVGREGLGAWARPVLAAAAEVSALDRRFSLTAVLLPGAPEPYDPELSFLAGRSFVDLRGDLDDVHATGDLLRAVGAAPAAAAGGPTVHDCPYRGLEVFREEDAPLFHGRRRETAMLMQKLRMGRFVAVLGASGSGKSSLVRAGLVPALREADPRVAVALLTPGAAPLAALSARLQAMVGAAAPSPSEILDEPRAIDIAAERLAADGGPDARLLVVVDQFEEVFSLTASARERRAFIEALVYAATIPDGRVSVVLSMRSDFYDRCADHPDLRALVAEHQLLVGPLGPDGLRAAIEEPAQSAGLELEPGLVRRIMADVADEPGSLPLLEHLLLELWRRRRGRLMTLEAYAASGGVSGALATRANAVYGGLDPEGQAIARRVLLRLTQPGEGTEDTRRRAALAELSLSPEEAPAVERVVETMAVARLLTRGVDEATGEPTVEVAHEALIRGWPELRRWVDRDRETLRLHRRLTEAAADWDGAGRDEGSLYRGARLAAWAERDTAELNPLEREFLDASRERAEREERTRRRRVRVTIGALGAGLAVLAAIAIFALVQRNAAADERDVARSRQIAATSQEELARDPERALLLALWADDVSDTPQAEQAVRQATFASRVRDVYRGGDGRVWGGAFDPEGRRAALAIDDGTVRLWDPASGDAPRVLGRVAAPARSVAFTPDGRRVVAGGADGSVVIFDVAGGRRVALHAGSGLVRTAAVTPDGRTAITAGEDGVLRMWDLAAGKPAGQIAGPGGEVWGLAVSADGRRIAAGTVSGHVRVWDARDHRVVWSTSLGDDPVGGVGLSANGDRLIWATSGGKVAVRDLARQHTIAFPREHGGEINAAALSRDGRWAVTGGGDGSVRVWPAGGGHSAAVLLGHEGPVGWVAFGSDGHTVMSGGADETARIWDWAAAGVASTPGDGIVPGGIVAGPAAGQAVVLRYGGALERMDLRAATSSTVSLPRPGDYLVSAAISPDGARVLGAAPDGVRVWTANGALQRILPVTNATTWSVAIGGDRAAGAEDGGATVRWRLAGSGPAERLGRSAKPAFAVGMSADGETVASTGSDGRVRVWRGTTRVGEYDLGAQGYATAVSPDGTFVAAAGASGPVSVWPVAGGAAPTVLRGHRKPVNGLSFSPDGRMLASAADDGVRIWAWPSGQLLLHFDDFGGPVRAAVFGSDNRSIVAFGSDTPGDLNGGVVRAWECSVCGPFAPVRDLGRGRVTRQLTPAERSDALGGS